MGLGLGVGFRVWGYPAHAIGEVVGAHMPMCCTAISVCGIVAFLYWQTHVLMNHPPLGSMIGAMLAGPPILAVCDVMSFVSQPLLTTKFV